MSDDGSVQEVPEGTGTKRGPLLLLAAALLAIAIVGVSCSSASLDASGGGPSFAARDVFTFSELPEMVATVDLVVLGTVTDVTSGRTVGPPEEAIQYTDATLRVDEVLKGSVDGPTAVIETLQLESYQPEWRRPGAQIIAFLSGGEPAAEGRYHPTNHTQSVFVVDNGAIRSTTDDAFAEQLAAMSVSEFRDRVAVAREQIARGEVVPEKPFGQR